MLRVPVSCVLLVRRTLPLACTPALQPMRVTPHRYSTHSTSPRMPCTTGLLIQRPDLPVLVSGPCRVRCCCALLLCAAACVQQQALVHQPHMPATHTAHARPWGAPWRALVAPCACAHCAACAAHRCIVSYESPAFADFALCILQKHNCRRLSASPPMMPGEHCCY